MTWSYDLPVLQDLGHGTRVKSYFWVGLVQLCLFSCYWCCFSHTSCSLTCKYHHLLIHKSLLNNTILIKLLCLGHWEGKIPRPVCCRLCIGFFYTWNADQSTGNSIFHEWNTNKIEWGECICANESSRSKSCTSQLLPAFLYCTGIISSHFPLCIYNEMSASVACCKNNIFNLFVDIFSHHILLVHKGKTRLLQNGNRLSWAVALLLDFWRFTIYDKSYAQVDKYFEQCWTLISFLLWNDTLIIRYSYLIVYTCSKNLVLWVVIYQVSLLLHHQIVLLSN